jgi:hypothetical protein
VRERAEKSLRPSKTATASSSSSCGEEEEKKRCREGAAPGKIGLEASEWPISGRAGFLAKTGAAGVGVWSSLPFARLSDEHSCPFRFQMAKVEMYSGL